MNGYRTKENIGNATFEKILKKIKSAVEQKQRELYIQLLSDETNIVADYWVFKFFQIGNGMSVFDVAQERVCERIREAVSKNHCSMYNLRVNVQVMTHNKRWYFKINTANSELGKDLFSKIPDLEKYCVTEDTDTPCDEEKAAWEEIYRKYNGETSQPMYMVYDVPLPLNTVKAEDLQYKSPEDRAEFLAQSLVFKEAYLTITDNNRKIGNPVELWRYVAEVLIMLKSDPFYLANKQQYVTEIVPQAPVLDAEAVKAARWDNAPRQMEPPATEPDEEV